MPDIQRHVHEAIWTLQPYIVSECMFSVPQTRCLCQEKEMSRRNIICVQESVSYEMSL